MKLDDRTIELIAVGASVTAGCQNCLRHHADKARHLGASDEEIAEAIAAGRMVRGGSATEMDRFAEGLTGMETVPSAREQVSEASGCDCGGSAADMQMEVRPTKVGVLPCSGEEEPEGTITRNAVRLVMEKYRPGLVVSLCLPLYLAGDGGEREFAKKVPVITVDGCDKSCARLATEKYSGEVESFLDVRDLFKQWGVEDKLTRSHPGRLEEELTEKVAQEIVKLVDRLVEEGKVEVESR